LKTLKNYRRPTSQGKYRKYYWDFITNTGMLPKRIIFLDYDGTLTGFHNDPQKASPDKELYSILTSLTDRIKKK
jgi:hypothetical protein